MKIKAIASFLGVFLLVAGLGTGVVLIRQKQLLSSEAAGACTTHPEKCNAKKGESCVNGVCKITKKDDNTPDAKTGTCVCQKPNGANCVPLAGTCTNSGGCNCSNGCIPKKNLCISQPAGNGTRDLPSCVNSFSEYPNGCIPAKYELSGGKECFDFDPNLSFKKCCLKGFTPATFNSSPGKYTCILK